MKTRERIAAERSAEAITKMVDLWLEKMNLPTSNKQSKQLFTDTIADIVEQQIIREADERMCPAHTSVRWDNCEICNFRASIGRPEGCICSEAYGVGPEMCGKHPKAGVSGPVPVCPKCGTVGEPLLESTTHVSCSNCGFSATREKFFPPDPRVQAVVDAAERFLAETGSREWLRAALDGLKGQ